jgi:hypothetical protein
MTNVIGASHLPLDLWNIVGDYVAPSSSEAEDFKPFCDYTDYVGESVGNPPVYLRGLRDELVNQQLTKLLQANDKPVPLSAIGGALGLGFSKISVLKVDNILRDSEIDLKNETAKLLEREFKQINSLTFPLVPSSEGKRCVIL